MFKFNFFEDKKVAPEAEVEVETKTTNSSELIAEETGVEAEDLDFSYKSPEYMAAENAFTTNPEAFKLMFEEEIESMDSQTPLESCVGDESFFTNNKGEIIIIDAVEIDTSVPDQNFGEVELSAEVGESDKVVEVPDSKGRGLARLGTSLAAAFTILAVAACEESDKFGGRPAAPAKEVSEHVVEKTEEGSTEEEVVEVVTEGGDEAASVVKSLPGSTTKKVEVEVEKESAKTKTRVESTPVYREGPDKEIDKLVPFMITAGGVENGYIVLNKETMEAISKGYLRYFPEPHVFGFETEIDQKKQGISPEAYSFYLLKHNLRPVPPMFKGRSLVGYINKETKVFDSKSYQADLIKSVNVEKYRLPNGVLDKKGYNSAVATELGVGKAVWEAYKKWMTSNDAQREALYNQFVVPCTERSGTIQKPVHAGKSHK